MLRELRRGQVRMPSSSLRNIQAHPKSKAVVMNLARMEWARYPHATVQYLVNHIRMQVRHALLLSASASFLPPLRTSHFRGNGREGVYNVNAKIWQSEVQGTAWTGTARSSRSEERTAEQSRQVGSG